MSDALRARDEALGRFVCADCGGTLAPPPGAAGDPLAEVACLDCGTTFPCSRGVLDLARGPTTPRVRTYPQGSQELGFWAFLQAALRLGAFRDTDLDEELFALLQDLDHEPGRPLLLLGGAEGSLATTVVEACPDSTVVVSDDDALALRGVRRPLAETGLHRWVLVRCDQDRPPLRPGGFAGVLHFGLLHGVPDAVSHLRALGRLLPEGGRVAGVTLARSNLPHIAASQAAMSAETGVRFVGMDELGQALVREGGWRSFRHEQPSHFLARFVAVRGAPG